MTLVARAKSDCKVCRLSPEQRQEVNAAIWDGTTRTAHYRAAGKRTYEAVSGGSIGIKAITAHADHTEKDWRNATTTDPAVGRERPVFPSDYESLTDAAAEAGAHAMSKLRHRAELGILEDREMLGLAKLGLGARQKQRELEQDKNRPQIGLMALFGVVAGHIQLPDAEVIEGVSTESLKEEVQAERRLLEARAAGPSED